MAEELEPVPLLFAHAENSEEEEKEAEEDEGADRDSGYCAFGQLRDLKKRERERKMPFGEPGGLYGK